MFCKVGQRVQITTVPGAHPAIWRPYIAEGIVVKTWTRGELILPTDVALWNGPSTGGRHSLCDRFVMVKDNGSFVWIPEPMFQFCALV